MARPSSLLPEDDFQSLVNEDTSMQDAFRIIEQEVDKHKNCIVALWKRRNTFAPISRLPPEVFCKIFDFTRQDETTGLLRWIKVSHICHEWRNIAVNSPSLWTKLPINNARWTEEMLSRSKMASLTVDATFSSLYRKFPVEAVSLALRHASRIRYLSLSDTNAPMIQKLLTALPKSAPKLETLIIHVTRQYSMIDFVSNSEENDCELPETVFCEMDRLHRLEITRCKINWDSHLFSSLTTLKIRDTPPASRPTATQLWNAFKRMPYLEVIDLQDTLPMAEDAGQPHDKIFLTCLQELTVISSTREVQLFLEGISFLPTVIIAVVCKSPNDSLPDFIGVLSVISSMISPSAKSPGINIRTLEILAPSPGWDGLRFQAYTDVASDIELESGDIIPRLDLSLRCRTDAGMTGDKILKDVLAAIPSRNLIRLHLKPNIRFSSRALAETLGTLPHLRSVYTTGICANCLTLALQEIPSNQTSTKSQNPGVFFPSLRSISMRNVSFDEGGDIIIGTLQDCLMWRYECGVEVRDLKLEECFRITEDDVDLLRNIVVDLEWDEEELGFTDEDDEDYDDPEYYEDDDSDADEYYGDGFNSYPIYW